MKDDNHNLSDAYFHTSFVFDSRRDVVWKEVCRFIQKKFIPENCRILDIGAGYCNFINNIQAKEKHAVDIFSRLPEYANKDVATHVHSCTNLDFFNNDSFDVIFASNLLEHLTREELLETLYELKRILRENGKLIILQANFKYCAKTYYDDYTHIQAFTERGLSEMLEAHGFHILEVKSRFLPVNMKTTLKFNLPKLNLITRLYLHLPYKPLAAQMLIVTEKTANPHRN